MSLPKFPAVKMLKKPDLEISPRNELLRSLDPRGLLHVEIVAIRAYHLEKLVVAQPNRKSPGMVPGQIECGNSSLLACAPSRTGGILMKLSSSFGNLKPASLNALPKSFSLGKSRWQVLQDVPYWRENAGIAWLLPENPTSDDQHEQSYEYATVREHHIASLLCYLNAVLPNLTYSVVGFSVMRGRVAVVPVTEECDANHTGLKEGNTGVNHTKSARH